MYMRTNSFLPILLLPQCFFVGTIATGYVGRGGRSKDIASKIQHRQPDIRNKQLSGFKRPFFSWPDKVCGQLNMWLCDLWGIYNSDNWEPEFMKVFVTLSDTGPYEARRRAKYGIFEFV